MSINDQKNAPKAYGGKDGTVSEPPSGNNLDAEGGATTKADEGFLNNDQILEDSVFSESPVSDELKKRAAKSIGLPAVGANEFHDHLDNVERSKLEKDPDLHSAVSSAYSASTKKGVMDKVVNRPDEEFTQDHLLYGDKNIPLYRKMSAPEMPKDKIVTGTAAASRMRESRGMGTYYEIGMAEVGCWVKFRPAKGSEISSLVSEMQSDQMKFGRESHGVLGSANSIYTRNKVVEFVADHVISTNIKDFVVSYDSIKSLLDEIGIQEAVWGMLLSMTPNGIEYDRPCIAPGEECNSTRKGTLSIERLKVTDHAAIPRSARDILFGKKDSGVTLADLKEYKNLLSTPRSKEYSIGDPSVIVTITSPAFSKSAAAGYKWVGQLTKAVASMQVNNVSDKEAMVKVKDLASASRARQYESYVSKIVDTSSGAITSDDRGISEVLEILSSEDDFFDELEESVHDFLRSTVINAYGVQEYVCVGCNTPQIDKSSNPGIIALDMISVFLLLCFRKWEAIRDISNKD